MHRDGPSLLLQLLYIRPEIRAFRVNGKLRILAVRHHADQWQDICLIEETLDLPELFPVHAGRDVVHSDGDAHQRFSRYQSIASAMPALKS